MSEEAYREFVAWLRRVGQSAPPPPGIVAYNFGLFESVGGSGYMTYLIGSRASDPENDEWACDEAYVPGEKYFELPRSFVGRRRWPGIRRGVVDLVRRFLLSPESEGSFLRDARAVTVGFDEGELVCVRQRHPGRVARARTPTSLHKGRRRG